MAATYKTRSRTVTKVRVDKTTGKKFTFKVTKWYADIYFGKDGPRAGDSTMLLGGMSEDNANALGTKVCYEYNQRRGDAYVPTTLPLDAMVSAFCSRKVDKKGKPIKPITHEHNQEQLDKFINGADIASIEDFNTNKIVDWCGTLKTEGAGTERSKANMQSTVDINLRVLKAFCNFCITKGWMEKNPVPNKLMGTYHSSGHYYTLEERKKLLAPIAPHHGQKLQESEIKADKLTILTTRIQQVQGLRVKQVWSLRLKDYSEADNRLFVIGVKRQDDKHVLCHPVTIAALREAAALNSSSPEERVFKNWGSPETMSQAFARKRAAVQIPKGRSHDNKHTAISELKQQGYSDVEIEEITNTDRMTIAKVYTHADQEKLKTKFNTFKVDGI